MALILKPDQICTHKSTCPYAQDATTGHHCQGTIRRKLEFVCDYVQGGRVTEGKMRNRYDKTGQMRVIQG